MVDLADKNAVEAKASNQGGRKSSTGLFRGPDFDGLYTQKRPADQESIARRNSITDQYKTGFIGRMWHNYVSGGPAGPASPSK